LAWPLVKFRALLKKILCYVIILVKQMRKLVLVMQEWILPCNVQRYELDAALQNLKKIEWSQSKPITNIEIGDIVYLYAGVPIQAICWKCEVTAVHRKDSKIDDSIYSHSNEQNTGPLIELKAVRKYNIRYYLSLECLCRHGLSSHPQGPRRVDITPELKEYLHEIDILHASCEMQEKDAQTQSMAELKNIVMRQTDDKIVAKKIVTAQFHRNPYVAEYTKRRANGYCQLCRCQAPFSTTDGTPYLESHHIIWLSHGGPDNIYNTVALCPNCHRKMHIIQDERDIKFLQTLVGSQEVP